MRGCNEYVYDAFGNLVSSLGLISQSYGFGGYYLEEEVRLYLIGRRWYDPEVGRYISRNSFYALSSPYLFSNNNPVSSLPVYTPPISDITTPDNPKDSFQWMLPGSGVFFGWERGIIYSQGSGIIFWCDNNCLFHRIKFKKRCWGLYGGISGGGGLSTLPSEGGALEISIPIESIIGIDIGFGNEGASIAPSIGFDVGIRWCNYSIISDEIIGKCK